MSKIRVVGIGPGDKDNMSGAALKALEEADVILGYSGYVDLVRPLFPDKEFVQTGMKGEVDRCGEALRLAHSGRSVAVICSGDAGVYGMASLILELAGEISGLDIGVIPGITAALSGAALLGAPLSNDFCVISLSDLLTPWELIEKRLHGAAAGEFCIVLYNPGSHHRVDHLRKACEILLRYYPGSTCCGIARQIGREEESVKLCSLEELRDLQADMFTTVFIGNRQSVVIDGRMVTRRGYRIG